MRLSELDPAFLKISQSNPDGGWSHCRTDATFQDCDGLEFLCPKCYSSNSGAIGTHRVICWKPSVNPAVTPGPGRWSHTGSSMQDLSLVAGSSSVKLEGGCNAHFHVQNGEIVNLT